MNHDLKISKTVKPKELVHIIGIMFDLQQPLFIWGPPGCGKSAIAKQVADEKKVNYYDIRATLLDPVDLRGVPNIITRPDGTRLTEWCPPDFLPNEEQALVNFDELNSAAPQVQAAFYQIILDRCVGNWKAKPGVVFIACGNREGDRGVVNRMPAPLANRFVHVELCPDVDDWSEWIYKKYASSSNEIEAGADIASFIRFKRDLLFKFDPLQDLRAFPTPRAWEKVLQQLIYFRLTKLPFDICESIASGTVGPGAAGELIGFLKLKDELPDVDNILAGGPWNVPKKIDVLHALCGSLATRANEANRRSLWKALWLLPAEFQVVLLRECHLRDQSFTLDDDWEKFVKKHNYLQKK